MKFAAIKGQMGIWRYYVTAFSFDEICEVISPITDEISNSESYSNLLQRSITDNVKSITDYLLNQSERMFNALVLAVYDGNPEWFELDVQVEEYSTYSVGVLELKGDETIFPVDGQHRVAGIKEAVKRNPALKDEKVPIILIGHENSNEGKKRTRRLFSTLNRRAKRVNDNEIIALDEDDVVAIATREMAENHILFSGSRLIDSKNKSIPSQNGLAFTSILTLYEVNKYLFDEYAKAKGMNKVQKERYLLYRPEDKDVTEFIEEIRNFWDLFMCNIPVINEFVKSSDEMILSKDLRSKNGGNLLFRPIALSQFVIAIMEYKKRKGIGLEDSIRQLAKIPMIIQERPWRNVLWLDERKNVNGRVKKKELMLLMLFLADEELLSEKEKDNLMTYMLAVRDMDEKGYDVILEQLKEFKVK
ncbi:MAG: DGQHR domain-containing protein [Lachnospiraceae bacterium]|nr:DGQHR domain-containing protein [Lachnospiraceae bacterium]MCM1237946.1 DGQHR domain-containing protein [Lachnospiraceae bacterium]